MNDAEHDAWLREALRHAPDADALPPSNVSDAILAQARAATRARSASRAHAAATPSKGALAALWAWLGRPPVAAGFASVMAATLVGLMWWDRPMDERLARPPAATAPAEALQAPAAQPQAPAATPNVDEAVRANTNEAASPLAAAKERGAVPRDALPSVAEAARDAKRSQIASRQLRDDAATSEAERPAPDGRPPARARSTPPARSNGAAPTAERSEAPAAFPESELRRDKQVRRESLGAAKKDGEAERSRAGADAVEGAPAPSTTPSLAPTPPAVAPAPFAKAAPAGAAAPSDAGALARPAPAAPPMSLSSRRNADVDDSRRRAAIEPNESAPLAATAPPAATAQSAARPSAPAASPLGDVLASIAADPDRWSRQAADGQSVALDGGWRAWLAELDAAASPRWRAGGGGAGESKAAPTGAASDLGAGAGPGARILRLVAAGGRSVTVRVEGATVQVETASAGATSRWQATLDPGARERLRAAARRLPP